MLVIVVLLVHRVFRELRGTLVLQVVLELVVPQDPRVFRVL
jgi:hypothetical protein